MKKIFKEQWFWLMLCFVAIFFILLVFIYYVKFPIIEIFKLFDIETIISIIGIILATVISLYSHKQIIKRDLKSNTMEQLSKIRSENPNLYSVKTANCASEDELKEKRLKYLKKMEFFCLGINEGVFSIEIATKMSGHLLVKQYSNYMKRFAKSRQVKGFEYSDYIIVMEKMTELLNQSKYKNSSKLEEDDF